MQQQALPARRACHGACAPALPGLLRFGRLGLAGSVPDIPQRFEQRKQQNQLFQYTYALGPATFIYHDVIALCDDHYKRRLQVEANNLRREHL